MNRTKKILLYLITVAVIVFAFVWNGYMKQWLAARPDGGESTIRTDLFVLYPLIITLVALSLYQLFKKERR